MERQYHALPIRELGPGAGFRRPQQARPARVSRESPAIDVMTDLTLASPATIRPRAPIEAANRYMVTRGVRLLLVVDARDVVLGLVTATDILGEAALRDAVERGVPREELAVSDVMTPAARCEVIELADVEGARVGHVMETLRRAGRQHALVVDHDAIAPPTPLDRAAERAMVRGIFSLTQIARQLGVPAPQPGEVARTFAEIESIFRH
ncbi:MAG: CBS domain-containing protein [Burkholderiales bacterium]